ncbi:MAG: symmetrical bis(5'-nucleosyl)-tetraphosphatase [Proteobacteria bacterium]|nr:symmetrical bis(5'-nucleosyl)-tetraphosphatase [Pseudomonadota bacterium]
MAVFAIGDVQGCKDELDTLLDCLQFDASQDRLWFVGDLVNRGPRSLDTLRFVKSLGDAAITVLGNHDLHLLALARGDADWRDGDAGLRPVVDAPDADELLDWLQTRPLLHHDARLGLSLLHAGLPPQWSLQTAATCADEVQSQLGGELAGQLYQRMYGNQPDTWRDDLDGWDRIRFTINALTRLRVCDAATGRMVLKFKGLPATAPAGTQPWFRIPLAASLPANDSSSATGPPWVTWTRTTRSASTRDASGGSRVPRESPAAPGPAAAIAAIARSRRHRCDRGAGP